MKNSAKFHLMTIMPAFLFYFLQFLLFLYQFRSDEGSALQILPLYVGLTACILGALFLILRSTRRQAFREFPEQTHDKALLIRYLQETARVPLRSFIILMISLVIGQAVLQAAYRRFLSTDMTALLSFSGLMVGYGLLVCGYSLISLEYNTMDFLYRQNITRYPLESITPKQKIRSTFFPVFVMVTTVCVTFFCSLSALSGAPASVLEDSGRILRFLIAKTVLPQSVFFLLVIFLVIRWARNNANLYHVVTSRLSDMASKDKNLTRRVPLSSVDEFAAIGRYVNDFSDMIADHLRETGQVFGKLDENQKDLSDSVSDSSSCIEDISSLLEKTIDSVASVDRIVKENRVTGKSLAENVAKTVEEVESQSASVAESSAAVEQMIASISEVTKRTDNVRENTDNLVRSFGEGEERVNKTISSIGGVAELSEGLIAINNLISGIAARTNLLAMNAAIEAAHAGDAGRGFSVVADEIRKLAENTASHTKSSSENLKRILDEIQTSLKAAQSTGVSFKGMKEGVLHIQDESLSIAESMAEHDRANREVLNQLTRTRDLAESLNEIAQSLTTQSRSMIDDLKVLDDESDISLEYGRVMREKNDQVKESLTKLNEVSSATHELNRQTRVLIESFKV